MELCNKNIYLHKSGPKEKNIRIHEVDNNIYSLFNNENKYYYY